MCVKERVVEEAQACSILRVSECRRSKLLLPFISRVGTAFSGFGVIGGKKGK